MFTIIALGVLVAATVGSAYMVVEEEFDGGVSATAAIAAGFAFACLHPIVATSVVLATVAVFWAVRTCRVYGWRAVILVVATAVGGSGMSYSPDFEMGIVALAMCLLGGVGLLWAADQAARELYDGGY